MSGVFQREQGRCDDEHFDALLDQLELRFGMDHRVSPSIHGPDTSPRPSTERSFGSYSSGSSHHGSDVDYRRLDNDSSGSWTDSSRSDRDRRFSPHGKRGDSMVMARRPPSSEVEIASRGRSIAPREHIVEISWTRNCFVRMLFSDEASFKAFLEFLKSDSITLNALRFHTAYTDLVVALANSLPRKYREGLPRNTIPTYGIGRFISPELPPTAPPLAVPSSLIGRVRKIWEKYLGDPDLPSSLSVWLPYDCRVSVAVAINAKDAVWCGVLDESVARILERVYTGQYKAFVNSRHSFQPQYPTPETSPLMADARLPTSPPPPSVISSSRMLSSRASLYSNTSTPLSPTDRRERFDSVATPRAFAPQVRARSSSLRPPPKWAVCTQKGSTLPHGSPASQQRSSSAVPAGRVNRHTAPPMQSRPETPRDSAISVGAPYQKGKTGGPVQPGHPHHRSFQSK
ncbi:uncharacterized protein EV422DRAFT_176015 [Fimicolochytrium jonesii]|uniref:uncharacterized protein n=1 Tax=Fimicolochytrium jonesii TaxID=1396493 RepID=UPI0022FF0888|nr:uncharacterized protein EV422DRAFT_176015 [Fimicolochytrium jonesii]KAI8818642.1 hypothetical protein EV422DRAFT_176015 [Fimicolochytrium jonesii]